MTKDQFYLSFFSLTIKPTKETTFYSTLENLNKYSLAVID